MLFLWGFIMNNFFQVKNLCYAYLKKPLCLKDVNFSAGKNDKILILGLDDKGKTTLIKTLSGFDDKYFGDILLSGTEIRKFSDQEKNFSLIFDYPVLLNASIDDNLNYLYGILNKSVPDNQVKKELLKKVKMEHDLKCKVKKLTLFEKFKLCFLRVLIKKPRIVFIDDVLKNNFSDDETVELFDIIELISKDCLLFFCANDTSFTDNKSLLENHHWSKILYLNDMVISEMQSLKDFYANPHDLNALKFNSDFEMTEAYCVHQDGEYYISIKDEYVIKIDKSLYIHFEKLKLANLENEDVILAYKKGLNPNFALNNDINKMMAKGDLLIFSKLDGTKIN